MPLDIGGLAGGRRAAENPAKSAIIRPRCPPPITYWATDMPAFSAACGSFHVKSSFTTFVTVFVTVRLLPFFLTVVLICSSTLMVSTFGARSYTDQRY